MVTWHKTPEEEEEEARIEERFGDKVFTVVMWGLAVFVGWLTVVLWWSC